MPTLYIIAGPNGSGKTTLAKEFIDVENLLFLNADEIARAINSQDIPKAYIQAGREFFRSRQNFMFVKKLVSYWELYYNGGDEFIFVAKGKDSHADVINDFLYNNFTGE